MNERENVEDIAPELSPIFMRFITWQNDLTEIGAETFEQYDIVSGLQALVMEEDLSDKSYDFVMHIFLAVSGAHPNFRLQLEKPKEGASFKRALTQEKARVSHDLANEIDVFVANGGKQEAAVQSAMATYDLSRREVFRRLKEQREQRKSYLEFALSEGSGEVLGGIPKGYRISKNGALVSIDDDT
jgi:hypothetical protein